MPADRFDCARSATRLVARRTTRAAVTRPPYPQQSMKVVSARSTITAMGPPSRQARLATGRVSRWSSPAKRTTRHEPSVEEATVNPTSSGSIPGECPGLPVKCEHVELPRKARAQPKVPEQRELRAKLRPDRYRTPSPGPQQPRHPRSHPIRRPRPARRRQVHRGSRGRSSLSCVRGGRPGPWSMHQALRGVVAQGARLEGSDRTGRARRPGGRGDDRRPPRDPHRDRETRMKRPRARVRLRGSPTNRSGSSCSSP